MGEMDDIRPPHWLTPVTPLPRSWTDMAYFFCSPSGLCYAPSIWSGEVKSLDSPSLNHLYVYVHIAVEA